MRQEAANLRLWLVPPRVENVRGGASPLLQLADPKAVAAQLRGSTVAREIEQLADRILSHRIPLLG